MNKEVSFIIPTVNEGDNLRMTIWSLQDTTSREYEIVVVDNGSTDGSTDFIEQEEDQRIRLYRTGERLGVANARNFGAAFAEGEFVVFVDAHMTFPHNWVSALLDVLHHGSVGLVSPAVSAWGDSETKGFGMSWSNAHLDAEWLDQRSEVPYPVPMTAGMCQAFRWDFFHEIGGYDPGMVGWGSEDLEICLRTWLLGYQVLIVPLVAVSHLFRDSAPYETDWFDVLYNLFRIVYAHFNTERIERIIAALQSAPSFSKALGQVNISDIWTRRRAFELKRKHDDDWFFSTFGINC